MGMWLFTYSLFFSVNLAKNIDTSLVARGRDGNGWFESLSGS